MKRYLIPLWVLCLGTLLVFSTGACGGSGGSTTPVDPLTLYSGTYCSFSLIGNDGVPDVATAQWGTFTPNGAGMVGATLFDNTNGLLGGPNVTAPLPYTVDAARTLALLFGVSPAFRGGVSADGKLACFASVLSTLPPALYIMGRKQGGLSTASLNGAYHFGAMFYNHGGMTDGSLFAGTITFDGVGGATSAYMVNNEGALAAAGFASTYSVAADGTLVGDFFASTVSLQGAVLCGTELLIAAGSTTGTEVPFLIVMIKKTAGASNATLSGAYHIVGLEADTAPPPAWTSTVMTVTSNAAGLMTIGPVTENDDGVISDTAAMGVMAAYSVAGDGALDISAGALVGGVSASGNVGFFAGGTAGGSDPALWFLLR